ncbi:hypothetical protein GGR52DRAFT_163580 [Hypoxylon sp. FL1284]|nr:hypothetical protein GGR52DRAFT_163580 [Hypoxylon sp. FL1284]
MASQNHERFTGRLYCRHHNRLACSVCLHSINSIDGFVPNPESSRFTCPESAHSVEPLYELFEPYVAARGFHHGLSPQQRETHKADNHEPQIAFNDLGGNFLRCDLCALTYFMEGGPGYADTHPSHVSADGKRYLIATVEPFKFERKLHKLGCTANFWFGGRNPKLSSSYECFVRPDSGTADWNLDNAGISAIVQLLRVVESRVIPHRKMLVKDVVYTNSEYFAGQAWRFQLVVCTMMNPATLDLLLRAHKLKYSQKRKAFVEKNALGLVSKKYPVTEERRRQIVYFIHMIKRLASYGIQVFWHSVDPSDVYEHARKTFMDDPSQLPRPQNVDFTQAQDIFDFEPKEARVVAEEDLVEGDSLEAMPVRDSLNAVEQRGRSLSQLDYLYSHPNTFHFD